MNRQTKNTWVDYKTLKKQLAITDVLQRFGVKLPSQNGAQLYGCCPIPGHMETGDGDNATAFSVNTEKNCWRCFTHCGAGNALELYALLSGKNPKDKQEFRAVALEVQEWLNGKSSSDTKPMKIDIAITSPQPTSEPKENKPLGFEIPTKKDVPFLLEEKRFPIELLEEFGIGWASKGMFSGRIVIGLHNSKGELVGYAARGLKTQDIEKKGRWRFPSQFAKHDLWNWHRLDLTHVRKKGLIIVEGFWSALRWHQAGYPVVALMGKEITDRQLDLILEHRKYVKFVWLHLDNDKAGQKATVKIASILARSVFVRLINYPENDQREQPEDFTSEELAELIPV